MQHIFARAMGWPDGAGNTQESQVLLPADNGEAGDSNHGQLTSLTEEDARPCVRFLATVPEEPEDDKEPAGGHGECREVREGSVGQWPKGGEQMLQVAIDR